MSALEYRFAAVSHFRLAAELNRLAEAAYQNGLRATEQADNMAFQPTSPRVVFLSTLHDNVDPAG